MPLSDARSTRGAFGLFEDGEATVHTVASGGVFARTLIALPQLRAEAAARCWSDGADGPPAAAVRVVRAVDDALREARLQREHVMSVRIMYRVDEEASAAAADALARHVGGAIGAGGDAAVLVPVIDVGLGEGAAAAAILQVDAMRQVV